MKPYLGFLIAILCLVAGTYSVPWHTGSAWVTRAWDCCKPACGWKVPGRPISAPVKSCARNGRDVVDAGQMSGCQGGQAFTCNNNQPWVGQNNVAYGFANGAFQGRNSDGECCACYELTFTSHPVNGQKMIVQITNTGHNYGKNWWRNEMEILFPGGGVGEYNACPSQWHSPKDGWGLRFGGVTNRNMCNNLPQELRSGCYWRFDWFKGANNPNANFKRVKCPWELTSKTGCVRWDDK